MTRNLTAIILLVILFAFGGLASAPALNINQTLQNYDPRGDENTNSSSAVQTSQTATGSASSSASLPPQAVIDLIDKITRIIEEITKILEEKASQIASADKEDTGKKDSKGGGNYTVQSGDTLWGIAERFLGAGNKYWDLVEANKEKYPSLVSNPNLIYPGWKLTIPGGGGQQSPNNPPSTSTPTPAPTGPAPAPGAKGGKALLGWLQQAGLSGEKLQTAWAVGMAESGGNPRAFNGNSNTGDKSYGLFQINMIGNLGPARLKQYGLKSNEDLFDPAVNVRVMIKMSGNCTNWSPWSAYKSGAYKRFLSQYPPK